MKNIIIYIAFFILIFSCKEEQKKPKIKEPVKIENSIKNKSIKLTIEVKFSKPDILEVFYREYDNNFTSQESLRNSVLGEDIIQKSIFIIPNEIIAPHLRFDFGEKEAQKVTIISMLIEFDDKVFEIPQNKIISSFNSSDWVEIIDQTTATIKPTKVSGRVDPKLTFSGDTVNEIIDFFNFN